MIVLSDCKIKYKKHIKNKKNLKLRTNRKVKAPCPWKDWINECFYIFKSRALVHLVTLLLCFFILHFCRCCGSHFRLIETECGHYERGEVRKGKRRHRDVVNRVAQLQYCSSFCVCCCCCLCCYCLGFCTPFPCPERPGRVSLLLVGKRKG